MHAKEKNEKFLNLIKDTRFVCAPMVNQSDLPFRLLCRELGVQLCYTPMIHSACFLKNNRYREEVFQTCKEDRPVVAQFCGNDPEILLAATSLVQHQVDAVDINFGCPQGIARKGNYGAFLLEQTELALSLTKTLVDNLDVAVTVKIRLLSDQEDTLDLCREFERLGVALIAVHGRTKEQNKQLQGACNLERIREINLAASIPVFVNGGASNREEALHCLEVTNCQAYMGAESLLSNPSCFLPPGLRMSPLEIVRKYLGFAEWCPVTGKEIKPHMFKFLSRELTILTDLRTKLQKMRNKAEFFELPDEIEDGICEFDQKHGSGEYDRLYKLTVPWYWRYFLNEQQQLDKHFLKVEMGLLGSSNADNPSEMLPPSWTCIVS